MTKPQTTFLKKFTASCFHISLVTLIFVSLTLPAAAAVPPTSAVKEFELSPALEISLFAAEPDVVDPVGMAFDEDGRIYVVEMRDYPLGIGPERKPGGTIRLLEDLDGDGKKIGRAHV